MFLITVNLTIAVTLILLYLVISNLVLLITKLSSLVKRIIKTYIIIIASHTDTKRNIVVSEFVVVFLYSWVYRECTTL